MKRVNVKLIVTFFLTDLSLDHVGNIKNKLNSNGWDITDVKQVTGYWYPTQEVEFLVTANIADHITNENVISVMRSLLSTLFNIVNINIVSSSVVDNTDYMFSANDTSFLTGLGRSLPDAGTGFLAGVSMTTVVLGVIAGYLLLQKRK